MLQTWAEFLMHYYTTLQPPQPLPNDIHWLHPQQDEEVYSIMSRFFNQFFNDSNQRTLLLGINPGRFGAGVTGVNFTAPRQLTDYCHITHTLKTKSELSAEFIYDMINQYGGPEVFYSRFFIGSVCPLGLVQHGKNLNYYDDKKLLSVIEPFIVEKLSQLISFHVNRKICLCIGGEKNFRYLSNLNNRYNWFEQIVPLPHPRFIMQYRRRQKQEYVDMYLKELGSSESGVVSSFDY